MAETGRLVFVDPSRVREGPMSGLFCVPKNLEVDRLILDARPPNAVEKVLSTWTKTMASATEVCNIELEPEQVLLMSGRDIHDFFYQFAVTQDRPDGM